MTTYTPDIKNSSATLADNAFGRKLQDPTRCDAPLFIKRFYYKNETGAALPDGTVIDLGPVLGPGVLLAQSNINVSALGASRVFNLGFNTYKDLRDNSDVAGSISALLSALDVSSAYSKSFHEIVSAVNPDGFEIYGAARLLCSVTGGTIPANAIIAGTLFIAKPL